MSLDLLICCTDVAAAVAVAGAVAIVCARWRRTRTRAAGAALATGLLLAAPAGFAGWLGLVLLLARTAPATADGIVVLTGREARMHAGFAYLRAGLGRRLLISGAGEGANRLELARVRAVAPAPFDALVDVAFGATNTAGNAAEAAAWAGRHGFTSLLVVSSAYHLPRGLVAFRRAMPETTLAPAPAGAPWPPHAGGLLPEYLKFVGARLDLDRPG